jgi:ubiquitin-conjugating enzyme E2 H
MQIFLPQLLTYPNPASPLNQDAAQLFDNDKEKYDQKVRDYIKKYAFNEELFLERKKSKELEELKEK